jgi:hypothetical protein
MKLSPVHVTSWLLMLVGFILVLMLDVSISSSLLLIGFLLIMHKAIVSVPITFELNIYFNRLLSRLYMYLPELMSQIFLDI